MKHRLGPNSASNVLTNRLLSIRLNYEALLLAVAEQAALQLLCLLNCLLKHSGSLELCEKGSPVATQAIQFLLPEQYLVLDRRRHYRLAIRNLGMAVVFKILDDHVTCDGAIQGFCDRLASQSAHEHIWQETVCLCEQLQDSNLQTPHFSGKWTYKCAAAS
jgi:hypothetical protein